MPSSMVTSAGAMMGTLGYASPEQIRGRAVDRRTDIFAFGALLFEMIAGGPPFPADTAADVVGKTLHKEPEWEALPAGLPPRRALQAADERAVLLAFKASGTDPDGLLSTWLDGTDPCGWAGVACWADGDFAGTVQRVERYSGTAARG